MDTYVAITWAMLWDRQPANQEELADVIGREGLRKEERLKGQADVEDQHQ